MLVGILEFGTWDSHSDTLTHSHSYTHTLMLVHHYLALGERIHGSHLYVAFDFWSFFNTRFDLDFHSCNVSVYHDHDDIISILYRKKTDSPDSPPFLLF